MLNAPAYPNRIKTKVHATFSDLDTAYYHKRI